MSIDPGKWLSLHKGYRQALEDAKDLFDAQKARKRVANNAAAEVLAQVICLALLASAAIVLILIFK